MHRSLGGQSPRKVDSFAHGHLLRCRHEHGTCPDRVAEDLEDPVSLGAYDANPDQLVDASRCGELTDDASRRGGVHHDEVVTALSDLETELADGEDLPYPGRGGRDEVEGPRDGPDVADGRDPGDDAEVLAKEASVSIDIATRSSLTRRPLKGVGPHS